VTERWAAVDRHLEALLPDDPRLEATLAASAAAGLPPHDVSPAQGRLLELLARLAGARRILEIGTLAGYSTLWLARALAPDGHLVTLEADPRHAAVARKSLAGAGQRSADYLAAAVGLSRPGTLIIADNVVRGGALLEAASEDPRVQGVRRLVDAVAAEPRLVAAGVQTVGLKGWDGMVLALVLG
jgi:predicted O-methyltransferase YrrM